MIQKNEIDKSIENYKKHRDDEYLGYLLGTLMNNKIYVAMYEKKESTNEKRIYKLDVNNEYSPVITITTDGFFWYTCYSDKSHITEEMRQYELKEMNLLDLINITMKEDSINGIAVNHKHKTLQIHLDKMILQAILMCVNNTIL